MCKNIQPLTFFGILVFLFLTNIFAEEVSASTGTTETGYIEYRENVFVNKELIDEDGKLVYEAACLLELLKSQETPKYSQYAIPQEENCVFWYKQEFDTTPYNYVNGLINGLPWSIASVEIKDPRISVPLGLIIGMLEAIKAPNTMYGAIEYYNCYHPNGGDFKKVMKLTKYYWDPNRTAQAKVYVG